MQKRFYPRQYQLVAHANPDPIDLTGVIKPYVSTRPYGLTRGLLTGLQNRIDMPGRLQGWDLHATIIYSTTYISSMLAKMSENATISFTAKPIGLEILGSADSPCLVLALKSKPMEKRNAYWQSLGCQMSWDEYKVHVTLFDKPWESDPTTTPSDWYPRMEHLKEAMAKYIKGLPELEFRGEFLEPIKEKVA